MKNLKISEELASTVLGKEVTKCSLINKARNSINITYFEDKEDFNTICREWNIYELAFKCKECANERGYTITSNFQVALINYNYEINITRPIKVIFYKKYEIEAIIEACEWILEQDK